MEMSLEVLVKRAWNLSVSFFSCWIEISNMAVEWMTWESVSILNETNGLFHLKGPIIEIRSIWHGGISFLQNSQGKTVSRPTVYLAFWSYFCLSRNMSVGSGKWMNFYSIWVVFVVEYSLCFIQKIHGDRIISDEGISVCFQHLLFVWFLFCLGQSWELRTDAAVSPPEEEISAMFSLVNVSCYTIFIEMASMGLFPGCLNVGLLLLVLFYFCLWFLFCCFLFVSNYLFIYYLLMLEHLTVRLSGSYHLLWEDGFFWPWLFSGQ